jgi:hypothetical protein
MAHISSMPVHVILSPGSVGAGSRRLLGALVAVAAGLDSDPRHPCCARIILDTRVAAMVCVVPAYRGKCIVSH